MTVITSSCYFPPAIFFRYFFSANKILVDAEEYFVKQTLRNRMYMCGANGKFPLIVPVKHTGGKLTSMKDILISYDSSWQKNHWRSLTSAYQNSPYFEYYEEGIAQYFFKREKFLFDFNEKILQTLFGFTGIDSVIERTEKYLQQYSAGEIDLRNFSDPVLFSQSVNATAIAPYPQVFGSGKGFIHGLSILDLLCNEGRNTLNALSPAIFG